MVDLYVYYKVREANCAELAARIKAMQQMLSASYAVAPALKRRPQASNGCQTWMEVYPDVDAGFAAQLDEQVMQAGLGALIEGARHTEVFTDCAPCA